jgi:hypothetical protein
MARPPDRANRRRHVTKQVTFEWSELIKAAKDERESLYLNFTIDLQSPQEQREQAFE